MYLWSKQEFPGDRFGSVLPTSDHFYQSTARVRSLVEILRADLIHGLGHKPANLPLLQFEVAIYFIMMAMWSTR